MTLTIHTEEDDQRQLKVTVEVPENRVQEQMRHTARDLAKQINIPGFRKGKVPYNVLVQRLGEEALRADAVEDMLESIVVEALEQLETEPYRQPTLDDMKLDPFVVELTVPLQPIVTLGDYRAIRKEFEQVEITDEAVADALEHIRNHHQILEEVERPVELGDMVTLSGEAKLEDDEAELIWQANANDLVMDPENVFPNLPFVENILGLSASEENEFNITFPEDYEEEELAGKTAIFNVTVDKVQQRELPELNDELAQQEGDYETVAELTDALREQLFEEVEQKAKNELMDEVIDEMLAEAELLYPPALVESELASRLQSFKGQITRSGWQWEDYLKLQAETEDTLREQWREETIESVRRGLILSQFVEQERLRIDSAEIDAELDKRLSRFSENQELLQQLRSIYSQGQGLQTISNDVLMAKVQDRMLAIISGNAPDLDALEAATLAAEEEE